MQVIGILLMLVVSASAAFAHSGGTDRNGCHQDHKRGGYHCH